MLALARRRSTVGVDCGVTLAWMTWVPTWMTLALARRRSTVGVDCDVTDAYVIREQSSDRSDGGGSGDVTGASVGVDCDATGAYVIREQSSDRSAGGGFSDVKAKWETLASLQPGVGDRAVDSNAAAGIVESSKVPLEVLL